MVRYIPASTRSESKRERGPASQTEVYDEPASSKAQATLTAILLPFRLEPSVVSSFALSGTVIVSHQRMEGDRFTYTLPFKPLMASCASPVVAESDEGEATRHPGLVAQRDGLLSEF